MQYYAEKLQFHLKNILKVVLMLLILLYMQFMFNIHRQPSKSSHIWVACYLAVAFCLWYIKWILGQVNELALLLVVAVLVGNWHNSHNNFQFMHV